jgi:hypothetical protein
MLYLVELEKLHKTSALSLGQLLAPPIFADGIAAIVAKLPENDPSPNNIHIMVGSKP